MFDGTIKTFLDVKDYVEQIYGRLSDDDMVVFAVSISKAMRALWASIKDDPAYLDSWQITANQDGTFTLPEGVGEVCSISYTTTSTTTLAAATDICTGEPFGGETVETTTTHCVALPGARCASCGGLAGESGSEAALVGDRLTVPGGPAKVTVAGKRVPGPPWWHLETNGGETCLVFHDVDLPAQYREALCQGVLGFMFFACGDAERGSLQMGLANSEIAAQQAAHAKSARSKVDAKSKLYRLGSRQVFGGYCGCKVPNPDQGWMVAVL